MPISKPLYNLVYPPDPTGYFPNPSSFRVLSERNFDNQWYPYIHVASYQVNQLGEVDSLDYEALGELWTDIVHTSVPLDSEFSEIYSGEVVGLGPNGSGRLEANGDLKDPLNADFRFFGIIGSDILLLSQNQGIVSLKAGYRYVLSVYAGKGLIGVFAKDTGFVNYVDSVYESSKSVSVGGRTYSNAQFGNSQLFVSSGFANLREVGVVRSGNYVGAYIGRKENTASSEYKVVATRKITRHDRFVQETIPSYYPNEILLGKADSPFGELGNTESGVAECSLFYEDAYEDYDNKGFVPPKGYLNQPTFRDPCWRSIHYFLQADPKSPTIYEHKSDKYVSAKLRGPSSFYDSSSDGLLFEQPTFKFSNSDYNTIQRIGVVEDRLDDIIKITSTGNRTVELFFKMLSTALNLTENETYWVVGSGTLAEGWNLSLNISSAAYNQTQEGAPADLTFSVDGVPQFTTPNFFIYSNVWNHLAIVKIDSNIYIYFNRQRLSSFDLANLTAEESLGGFTVGSSFRSEGTGFEGWLQDIVWWEVARYSGTGIDEIRRTLLTQERYYEDRLAGRPFVYDQTSPAEEEDEETVLPEIENTSTYVLTGISSATKLYKGFSGLYYGRVLLSNTDQIFISSENESVSLSTLPVLNALTSNFSVASSNQTVTKTYIIQAQSYAFSINSPTSTPFEKVLFARSADITINSESITFKELLLPVFTQQPTNKTVGVGGTAVFSATVSSASFLSYQWFDASTNLPISGLISSTAIFSNVSINRDGLAIYLRATNEYGYRDSDTVTLNVSLLPVITLQPQDVTVGLTENASFSVTASNVDTYKWYPRHIASSLEPNSSILTLTVNDLEENGSIFFVDLTNSYGTVRSDFATLTIGIAPVISEQPSSITVSSNDRFLFRCVADDFLQETITYQWQVDTGSGFSNIDGETEATYISTASLPDNGHQYRVICTNSYGTTISDAAILTVTEAELRFGEGGIGSGSGGVGVGLPNDVVRIVQPDGSVDLVVVAEGSGPLSYQWYELVDGEEVILAGETSDTFSAPIDVVGRRQYKVVVTDNG